ncbi:hypothetical protein RND81_14G079500 [Saponaria officinalis]|uniref:Outer envelope pore protein 37, chloroplastic n=1 Tax=Saponaria officinalis TaxID=3572 RepID=A0AAW1GRJ2_SAPOF
MATTDSPPSTTPLILFPGPSSFQPHSPPSQQPPQHPPPQPPQQPPPFSLRNRPKVRLTTEFDSDSSVFFHKVSSKLFDGLAKLKLSFSNSSKGEVADPQVSFVSKNFSVDYDVGDGNALFRGFVDVGPNLKFKAAHDLKNNGKNETYRPQIGLVHKELGLFTRNFSAQYYFKEKNTVVNGSVHVSSRMQLRVSRNSKAQQGEVTLAANLSDPGYQVELASAVPSIGLPKATLKFPCGEVSVEEKEDEEVKKILSLNGIVKGSVLNGLCTALYKDENLNLRYSYKDEEMSFIPSISLPSNAVTFAFKRRFGPSDKLSYWYNFDSNYWSTVYKHTAGKDYKFKAGYDSEIRLSWASLWVGDESGKAKTAPMKMKLQFMLQVPQDDVKSSVLMFRVKKRWDI